MFTFRKPAEVKPILIYKVVIEFFDKERGRNERYERAVKFPIVPFLGMKMKFAEIIYREFEIVDFAYHCCYEGNIDEIEIFVKVCEERQPYSQEDMDKDMKNLDHSNWVSYPLCFSVDPNHRMSCITLMKGEEHEKRGNSDDGGIDDNGIGGKPG